MVLTASETTVQGSLLYFAGKIYGETVDFLVDTGVSNSFVPRELVQALYLPVADYKPTTIELPNGSQMKGTTTCKILVWFSNNCCITIRFLVVVMKLPFVLGIEVLHRAHTQLDLKACMLTLSGDDGSITEVLGLYK